MLTKRLKYILIVLVIVANIGCDQISKKIVRTNIAPYEQVSVIRDYATLTNVENEGAFLSMGTELSAPLKKVLLNFLPLLILTLGTLYILKNHQLSANQLIAFSFIIGGGLANLFDRIRFGSVTDFMHIDLGIFQTGIFNMADLSIITGVVILLVMHVRSFIQKKEL